jgi:hypothetical protein
VTKPKVHPWLIYLICIIVAIGLMLLVWQYYGERIKVIDETSF